MKKLHIYLHVTMEMSKQEHLQRLSQQLKSKGRHVDKMMQGIIPNKIYSTNSYSSFYIFSTVSPLKQNGAEVVQNGILEDISTF